MTVRVRPRDHRARACISLSWRALADRHRQVAVGDLLGGCGDLVHGRDQRIQVVLDGVEVAVVGVGDLRRNVALADPVHIVGGDVQRPDDGIQNGVHAAHDIRIGALELIVLAALRQACPPFAASVSRASSFCRPCRTAPTLLTACFIFSWSPL